MEAQLGSAVPAGTGPYVFTIHGQIYHNTSAVRPGDDATTPIYAQLYILDSTQANEHRMNFAPNQVCDGELMSQLDALLRQVNPYANIYKNMREMIEEEERLSVAEGRPRMQVGMVIHNDRKTQDERRYNSPTGDEIAFIFKSPDGIPPKNRDVVGHLRIPERGHKFIQIHTQKPMRDPMTYPLIFPMGDQGWNCNTKTLEQQPNDQTKRTNIKILNPILKLIWEKMNWSQT